MLINRPFPGVEAEIQDNVPGEAYSLRVERLIWRGRSLSHLPSGKAVIIDPGYFPGEKVRVRIKQEKKDYCVAECTEILEPAAFRRVHPCSLSAYCGGCTFGSIPNRIQLHFKKNLLLQELKRELGSKADSFSEDDIQIYKSRPAWRYRWRGQVHVRQGKPHFSRLKSRELVYLPDCLLLARALSQSLKTLCRPLPDGRYIVAASPDDHQCGSQFDKIHLKLPVPEDELTLEMPPGNFFQANWKLNRSLIQYVHACLQGFARVADLYSGGGNFALPLGQKGLQILALDADESSLQAAEHTRKKAGLDNVEIKYMNMASPGIVDMLAQFKPQALVVDPPRSGGSKSLAGLCNLQSLRRLVWISCDVVNTCRDLRPFVRQGWEIKNLALFDMFPQTWHMEVVFTLDFPGENPAAL